MINSIIYLSPFFFRYFDYGLVFLILPDHIKIDIQIRLDFH
ncbi:hypothetical protein NJ7G_1846 [Natrinema sp. J7-2]|nr:hypothetical protein NJ7G_1846 [Natrinema sp. J7-2]